VHEVYTSFLIRHPNISPGAAKTIARASSQEKAIEALVRDVQRDFREERSVQVEGWILSRTEAELCLLTLLKL
jgi:hypothetical protein